MGLSPSLLRCVLTRTLCPHSASPRIFIDMSRENPYLLVAGGGGGGEGRDPRERRRTDVVAYFIDASRLKLHPSFAETCGTMLML